MEEKEKKLSKNVLKEEDKGDYILQRRRVDREGMVSPLEYDLKIPKNEKAWMELYGFPEWNRLGIASLKTENDDAIETSGKPVSEEKKFKTALKGASEKQREEIAKILGISVADAGKAIAETAKNLKKAGFGK